jgi:MinD-like ATPase involved in chromosome partitioning or flagellar assembly
MILESLAESCDLLVADLGSEDRCQPVILRGFDVVILVAASDPISLTRLVKVAERLDGLVDRAQLVAAINETPRRRFHRGEIRSEMARALPGLPMLVLPFDKRVQRAVWDGKPTSRGPFTREVERIADLVAVGTP